MREAVLHPEAKWEYWGHKIAPSANADIAKVTHPSGDQYFVKHAGLGSAMREDTANKIQRLLNIPGIRSVQAHTLPKTAFSRKHVISPFLEGQTFVDLQHSTSPLSEAVSINANKLGKINPLHISSILLSNWLMGASDRHIGNYMYSPDFSTIHPIDYGVIFNPRSSHKTDALYTEGVAPWGEDRFLLDKNLLRRIIANRQQLHEIGQQHYKNSDALPQMYDRLYRSHMDNKIDHLEKLLKMERPTLKELYES